MEFITNMIMRFYDVLTHTTFGTPNFTDLMRLAESVLNKEPEKNAKQIKELEELNNKVPGVGLDLAKLELVFFKNIDKGISGEVEIKGKTYTMGDLYMHLQFVLKELTRIISKVAYEYDLDIPLTMGITKR